MPEKKLLVYRGIGSHEGGVMKRHWSFIVTDPKYLYSIIILLLIVGFMLAIYCNDPSQFSRVGGFIIGIGVWMSFRYTLREGINKYKNASDSQPMCGDKKNGYTFNSTYFNNIAYSIGDAKLQLHGFIIVIIGSIISSYGDLILKVVRVASAHLR